MKPLTKAISALLILLLLPASILAHPGRTDRSGGHRDNNDKSGLGSYHYHCGGHPAHLHTDGCPYAGTPSSPGTAKPSPKHRTSSEYDAELAALETANIPFPLQHGDKNEWVKRIQGKLIELNYLFDRADGVYGENTKTAVEQFQGNNDFAVDGIVTSDVYVAIMYWTYAE